MKNEKVKKSKKKKVITILVIVFAVIALILAAGYIALNMAFSMLTESLYDVTPVVSQEPQQEEVVLSENKGAETLPPEESIAPDGANNSNQTTKKDTKAPAKKDALTKTQEKYGIDGSMNFTPEKVKKFEKAVSLADKLSMLAIISGSLSQSDFQKVLALTNGGVTREEVNQALVILQNCLTGKEKSEIYKYYKKYAHLLE
ncbi:MAG: hypothetical protein IKW59_07880 [Clostridia bacterium]|nr:hypothetical protein [Clostridia bacterium]